MKGRAIKYSEQELAWVKENCTMVITELHQEFCALFNRTDVSSINLASLRKRNGWKTGRTGRFETGSTPPNKGKSMPARGRSVETQFKPGHKPANHKPIGSERVCSKDGFILIKVAEKCPHTGRATRYRLKHHVVWEKHNGPIPSGKVIRFKDGDKQNCQIDNLEMFEKAEHLKLNKLDVNNMPGQLHEPVKTLVRLESAISKQSQVA